MREVRTTKQPWHEVEVSDAEYLDLQRQGLLTEESSKSGRAAAVTPKEK